MVDIEMRVAEIKEFQEIAFFHHLILNKIIPEKDIDQSLNAKGSIAYKAVVDGEMVGVLL